MSKEVLIKSLEKHLDWLNYEMDLLASKYLLARPERCTVDLVLSELASIVCALKRELNCE